MSTGCETMKGIIIPGNITGHSIFVEALVGAIVLLIGVVGYSLGLMVVATLGAVIGGAYVLYSAWSSSKILNGMPSPGIDAKQTTIRYTRAPDGGYIVFESDEDMV